MRFRGCGVWSSLKSIASKILASLKSIGKRFLPSLIAVASEIRKFEF